MRLDINTIPYRRKLSSNLFDFGVEERAHFSSDFRKRECKRVAVETNHGLEHITTDRILDLPMLTRCA